MLKREQWEQLSVSMLWRCTPGVPTYRETWLFLFRSNWLFSTSGITHGVQLQLAKRANPRFDSEDWGASMRPSHGGRLRSGRGAGPAIAATAGHGPTAMHLSSWSAGRGQRGGAQLGANSHACERAVQRFLGWHPHPSPCAAQLP